MINEPSEYELVRKLGKNGEPISRYELCVVAAKRVRQIIEQEQSQSIPTAGDEKEIVTACKEIMSGKIGYTKD